MGQMRVWPRSIMTPRQNWFGAHFLPAISLPPRAGQELNVCKLWPCNVFWCSTTVMHDPDQGVELVYIGIGSNLGDRSGNLNAAVTALWQLGSIETVSSFYETEPVENHDQPMFVNCVVALRTSLPPERLIDEMLVIELSLGRDRFHSTPKGPRIIDLDLLLYGNQQLSAPCLKVPHPAMHWRRFVLEPLSEIAPGVVHPVLKKTALELLHDLKDQALVRRIS
jgi:2-amino-4-hydroxy-6-hydroxymethyldihydropteridine diphosphokinase